MKKNLNQESLADKPEIQDKPESLSDKPEIHDKPESLTDKPESPDEPKNEQKNEPFDIKQPATESIQEQKKKRGRKPKSKNESETTKDIPITNVNNMAIAITVSNLSIALIDNINPEFKVSETEKDTLTNTWNLFLESKNQILLKPEYMLLFVYSTLIIPRVISSKSILFRIKELPSKIKSFFKK